MKLTRLIAGAAFCVAAFGAVQPASAEDPSGTWRWAHFSAEAWGSSQADKLFAEELKELTDGKLDTRFYWAGAMGSGTELLELTANNAVDVGSFVPSYFPGQMPLMSLVNSIPLTFTDPVVAMEVQQKLAMDNPYFQEELKKNKVYPILFHGLAPYRLQCTTPVRKIEDIKGLRVRTFGEWPPKMFEQLGAVPVNIGMVEVWTTKKGVLTEALARKVIEKNKKFTVKAFLAKDASKSASKGKSADKKKSRKSRRRQKDG